jgi:PAS domain S-box-containing protein
MGVSGVNSAADLAVAAGLPAAGRTAGDGSAASPVELVEFAVGQVLREETAVDALPTILGRLAALFGCRAAFAFQQGAGQELVILAAHPRQAGADQALRAEICALSAEHGGVAAEGGCFVVSLAPGSGPPPGGRPASILMAYSAPDSGRCLCAIALVGNSASWNAAAQSTTRAIAAIVAVQIRHSNDTAELAERQVRTAALIEGSPDGIIVVGADGRLVVFNKAAEELTGWRRDELRGKQMVEVIIPERERPAVMDGMRRYLESGDRGEFVGRIRLPFLRADGTERKVEMTPVPITIEGQAHFCAFIRDIGELERANAALQESEARMRLLSQLAPVGIMQTGLNGLVTFVNDRWCELTGLTARDAVGATWSAGFHPDDLKRLERGWRRAAARAGELRTDCRLRPAGETTVWVNLAVVPIHNTAGRPEGFLSAITNVSERKRAEAEKERLHAAERAARRKLADQTERLNGLITAAIPGILVEDEHGRITQVNKSFCAMFGIAGGPAQLIGTLATRTAIRIRRVFADPDEFLRRAADLLAGRRPVAEQEIAAADGRTIECDFAPVFVEGDYRGVMWGVADVTHRQVLKEQRERLLKAELAAREAAERAQGKLAEQNARLQELDEAKTQFLATMSHELRTPLTSIVSFTELILDDQHELTPETVRSLAIIQRNAERLLRLVGDLLLLNRLEAGAVPLDLALVSVPDLVSEAARSASATAAEHGITVQVAAAHGPPIQADLLRLQQVLDNLLSNAIKFSAQGGRVRVEASLAGQMWQIDVTDDGIGIPADELGQLFGRFVRASNARTAGLPGTGLGLSVVKAITELHGGHVELRSTVGSGTTFSVYLPVSS